MTQIKKLCNTRNYLIVMFGLAFSFFFGGAIACRTLDVGQFFSVGTVCDFDAQNLREPSETFVYQEEEDAFLLTSDLASKLFSRVESDTDLHYLVFEISHLRQEPVDAVIYYRDVMGTYRGSQEVSLCNGQNWVYATVPEFRFFILEIKGQEGRTIAFDAVCARERAPVSKKTMVLSVFACFLFYLLLVAVISRKARGKNSIAWMLDLLRDMLVCFYELAYRLFLVYIPKNLTESRRKGIRTALFAAMFVLLWLSNVQRWYMKADHYKFFLLVVCAILVMIAGVSARRNPFGSVNLGDANFLSEAMSYGKDESISVWRPGHAWMMLCVSMCLSDFFVSKFYKFTGWIFLIVFGVAFYSWKQMRQPQQLLEDMARSLRMLFWPGLLFCIFCRRKMGAILYHGLFRDSDTFAVYAVLMLLIFLAGLSRCFSQGSSAGHKRYYGLGILVSWYYLLSSGSAVCLLLGGAFTVFGLWKNCRELRISRSLVVFLGVGVVLVFGIHICARNIPQNTRLQVKFQNEVKRTWKSRETIHAMRQADERNYRKVIRKQETGYGKIWLAYLRRANLFGHDARALKLWGKARYPANCLVTFLYRYGMITLIFYILFLYRAGKYAFCLLRQKQGYGTEAEMITCGSIVIFLAAGLLIETELPFLLPVWLVFYMAVPADVDVKM